jgi:hypothetical protein
LPPAVRNFFCRRLIQYFAPPYSNRGYLDLLGAAPRPSSKKRRDVALPLHRLRDVEIMERALGRCSAPPEIVDVFGGALLDGMLDDIIEGVCEEQELLASEADDLTAGVLEEVQSRFYGGFAYHGPKPSCDDVEECQRSLASCAERVTTYLFVMWVTAICSLEDLGECLAQFHAHMAAVRTFNRAYDQLNEEDRCTYSDYFFYHKDLYKRRAEGGPTVADQVAQMVGFLDRFGALLRIALPVLEADEAALRAFELENPPPGGENGQLN